MTRIEAIIFDAGGVLLHPNCDWIISAGLSLAGLSLTQAQLMDGYYRMAYAADVEPAFSREGIAMTSLPIRIWLFERLLKGAQVDEAKVADSAHALAVASQRDFPRESGIYFWARPGLRPCLQRLIDAGARLAVASNNDGGLVEQLTTVGVIDLFEELRDSGLEGVAKPDPELLLRVARRMKITPQNCLYVGDIDRVDGAAARAAGMHFALLDPLQQPRFRQSSDPQPLMLNSLDEILTHFKIGNTAHP